MADLLHTVELQTGENPTASIIWMHGLGADANDFVPIVPELDLRDCSTIRFMCFRMRRKSQSHSTVVTSYQHGMTSLPQERIFRDAKTSRLAQIPRAD